MSSDTINFIVDGNTQICIDISRARTNNDNNHNENDQNENNHNENNQNKNNQNENEEIGENGNTSNEITSWCWNNKSTKLLLDLYKSKKTLVNTRKIKTYKLLWKEISEDLKRNGYSVSPLQVENKIKSLERSYKNMISNNKMTGRARKTCKYEA